MHYKLLATALLVFANLAHAGPEIHIGDTHELIEADGRTLLKRVSNSGSSTAFVRVEVLEIVYENHKPIERPVPTVSMAQGAREATLVASPARLIIPAKSVQTTRLLAMGPRDVERYYRVRFVPVMPSQHDDFALSDEQHEQYAGSLSAGLTVMTGYGAIVAVRPDAPHYDTRMQDAARQYTLRNAGNTMVILTGLKDCNASGADCTPETVRRVLPGREIAIEKNAGRHYRATLVEGKREQNLSF